MSTEANTELSGIKYPGQHGKYTNHCMRPEEHGGQRTKLGAQMV